MLVRHVLRAALPVGRHRDRARVRERAHRHGARGDDLRLAGDRPVRLPQRRHARPARDHGREPLRRGRLHHGQLRRRRPLRRHRPADPGRRERDRHPGGAAAPQSSPRRWSARRGASRSRSSARRSRSPGSSSPSSRRCSRRTTRSRRASRPFEAPSSDAPLRHRRARARRALPRDLRRAHLAAARACCSSCSPRRSAASSARSPATSAASSDGLGDAAPPTSSSPSRRSSWRWS